MSDQSLQPSQEAREAARRAAADYLIRYNEWSPDEAQKIINGHKDHLATVSAFIGLAGTVNALASSSDGLREAVERFIADYDDGDRADAGCSAPMDGHVSDFRAALSTNPSSDATTPIPDESLQRLIGELGNQIHNLGCEYQGNEALSERLKELRSEAWRLARLAADADALREALDAEDAYWDASRAYAAALPRLREQAKDAFDAATIRREKARTALQPSTGRE